MRLKRSILLLIAVAAVVFIYFQFVVPHTSWGRDRQARWERWQEVVIRFEKWQALQQSQPDRYAWGYPHIRHAINMAWLTEKPPWYWIPKGMRRYIPQKGDRVPLTRDAALAEYQLRPIPQ